MEDSRTVFACTDCGNMTPVQDAIIVNMERQDTVTCVCRSCVKRQHKDALRVAFHRGIYAKYTHEGGRHTEEDGTL